MKSENNTNIVDITGFLETKRGTAGACSEYKNVYKNQTNPIMKRELIINLKDNKTKFKVSDLFN